MATTIGFLRNKKQQSTLKNDHIATQDFRHVLITGATGSGKTASIIMPTLQDRILKNNTVIFFDFKGHEHQKLKRIAWQNDRLHDVIELGKPTGQYFNLMSMFSPKLLHSAIIKLCGGVGKDPYWSTSAAQLAVRIVELHRQWHNIANTLVDEFNLDKNTFTLNLAQTIKSDYDVLKVEEEASFATLNKIIHTPSTLVEYFKSLDDFSENLNKIINEVYEKYHVCNEDNDSIRYLVAEIQIFVDAVNKYSNFAIETASDESSGNNAVLQILSNAISMTATTDFINVSQIDIMHKIENKSIIIIDIQSIPKNIYSVFVEALLQKLTERIKYKIPEKVSIFIDEANRILEQGTDMYVDVLRESRTELILSAQNEEQMILKFGTIEWDAIRENILHHFEIKNDYNIFYGNRLISSVTPHIFSERELELAEQKYNHLDKNSKCIQNRFISKSKLSKYYIIKFNPNTFFQTHTIELHTLDGSIVRAKYIGEDIKIKTESRMTSLAKNEDETIEYIIDKKTEFVFQL